MHRFAGAGVRCDETGRILRRFRPKRDWGFSRKTAERSRRDANGMAVKCAKDLSSSACQKGLSKLVSRNASSPPCLPPQVFALEMGFSAAKIVPPHPYTPLNMIENSRGLRPSCACQRLFGSLARRACPPPSRDEAFCLRCLKKRAARPDWIFRAAQISAGQWHYERPARKGRSMNLKRAKAMRDANDMAVKCAKGLSSAFSR